MLTLAQEAVARVSYTQWANQTTVHPVGLTLAIILCSLVLFGSKRLAVVSFFVLACFLSTNQRIVIANLDFDFTRLLIIAGLFRVIVRGEFRSVRRRKQDLLIILFVLSSTLGMVIRTSGEGLENRLGFALDSLGLYFLFRTWVRSGEDLIWILKGAILVSIPVVFLFGYEHFTGHNPFSFLGGVNEAAFVRKGRIRCQGAFPHSILAGVFFAVLASMYFGAFLSEKKSSYLFLLGIFICGVMVYFSSSSTPASSFLIGIIAWMFYPIRRDLRAVQWVLGILAVSLHFAMEQGIWHVLARIDLVGGSTGYHRYFLIDRAIAHLDEWWLMGTNSTAHWGWHLFDVTNQYIRAGTRGGILTMFILIAIIVLAFASVGELLRSKGSRVKIQLAFGLGVAMVMHSSVFISVSYFGQIIIMWFFTLAAIESLAENAGSTRTSTHSPGRNGPPRVTPSSGWRGSSELQGPRD